jgi:ankyrin repeat protein
VVRVVAEHADALEAVGCGKQPFEGKTPLMYALQCGHTEVAGLLLDHQAKVNATMTEAWRWPALHFAVRAAVSGVGKAADLQILQRMLTLGADPNLKDAFGNTALDRALMDYDKITDRWPVVEVLLQAGADRESVGPAGTTTAQGVVTNKHCYSAKVLSLLGVV